MASTDEAVPAPTNHSESKITHVKRIDEESNSTSRAFSITTDDGGIVICTANVRNPNTVAVVDDVVRKMGLTVAPIADLERAIDELADVAEAFAQVEELDKYHRGVVSQVFDITNQARQDLKMAKHYAKPNLGPGTMRQNRKIEVIGSATRTYHSAVQVLDAFFALDNLRQDAAIEQARKDAATRLTARGKLLFTMWKVAFDNGLFV